MVAKKLISLSVLYAVLSCGFKLVYCTNTMTEISNSNLFNNFEKLDLSNFGEEFTHEELRNMVEVGENIIKLLHSFIKLRTQNLDLTEKVADLKTLIANGELKRPETLNSGIDTCDSIDVCELGNPKGEQRIRKTKKSKKNKVKEEGVGAEGNNDFENLNQGEVVIVHEDGSKKRIIVEEVRQKGHTHNLNGVDN